MLRRVSSCRTHWSVQELRPVLIPKVRFSAAPSLEALAAQSMATAFRQYGHLQAELDPLQLQPRTAVASLAMENFHPLLDRSLVAADLARVVAVSAATGQQLYDELHRVYCRKTGFEFEHLTSREEKTWLARAAETATSTNDVTPADLRNAYSSMVRADVFETFMAKKFASFKRYSGEGAESMLPAVETVLQACTTSGISDVVIGMPHRGRLALLVGSLGYPAHKIFHKVRGYSEFPDNFRGIDDVSSHIATTVDKKYAGKNVHVSLVHNPSHLEIINAVAAGKVRAKNDGDVHANAMALLLHGDAAFAGQGCVTEALALSQLPDFHTGGSVHIVVNNQVGYTTTYPDGRGTRYASDVAKSIEAPILHVNGESIADVVRACRVAVAYRNEFHKDIVIDLITFRRHGHNEVDEPRFTQPKMYERVDQTERFPIRFARELEAAGLVSRTSFEKNVERLNEHLESELKLVTGEPGYKPTEIDAFKGKWSGMRQPEPEDLYINPATGVEIDNLIQVGLASVELPERIRPHGRLQRTHIKSRQKSLTLQDGGSKEDLRVDWATAEAMAFGTLMQEGHSVRLSGQDCRRGTFSQRHASFTDQDTEERYFPLQHHLPTKSDAAGKLCVANSNLSELAVMGYDGRVERFLQLVDTPALIPRSSVQESSSEPFWKQFQYDTNMIVVNVTTPANFFHLVRRQQQRSFRKPVVVMGPKMLLRLADATSPLSEMGPGTTFQPVLSDLTTTDPTQVKTVYFCSGKFFYELSKERLARSKNPERIALVRIEELAPFPFKDVADELAKLKNAKHFVWAQEEPLNQGAWMYAKDHIEKVLDKKKQHLEYIGRESLAAPAAGLAKRSHEELELVLTKAFGPQK
uniref:Transketolase-like pyrimidine-binding domain-containing protein n=1 Tax=Hyaloperonospora arabidopsidis (strain Emoy2) TaxID=559515 RepID=M4C1A6_HYAAE